MGHIETSGLMPHKLFTKSLNKTLNKVSAFAKAKEREKNCYPINKDNRTSLINRIKAINPFPFFFECLKKATKQQTKNKNYQGKKAFNNLEEEESKEERADKTCKSDCLAFE